MKWNELVDITPAKLEELRSRIARLNVDLNLIEEKFVKGGGKGGQKINKTNNCVVLTYPPHATAGPLPARSAPLDQPIPRSARTC